MNIHILRGSTILAALILAGCIPDTITYSSPAAPSLNLTVDTKLLKFSWDKADDTLYYRILENIDGSSGFSQIAYDFTATTTSYDYEIPAHLHDWDNASYILEACNIRGCSSSSEVNTFGEFDNGIGYLKASNVGTPDLFGSSVAFSKDGKYIAIGAPDEASNSTNPSEDQADDSSPGAGAVYIFDNPNNEWAQDRYLKADSTTTGFGTSVALNDDGEWLAVGAPADSAQTGKVFTYVRGFSDWVFKTSIAGLLADDQFGQSVALGKITIGSGTSTVLVVGATGRDVGGVNAGAVYIYYWNVLVSPASWDLQATLTTADANANFGVSVDLSEDGKTLVVGTNKEEVYVYKYNDIDLWGAAPAILTAANNEVGDLFGSTVAVDETGDTIIVGAKQEDSSSIGINGNDNNAAAQAGAAYVFKLNNIQAWNQHSYIKASDSAAGNLFGTSVDINDQGNIISIGSPGNNKLYSFEFNSATDSWAQSATVAPSFPDAGDNFGTAISMSSDGRGLIVGASGEDSDGQVLGVNPQENNDVIDSGAAFLF